MDEDYGQGESSPETLADIAEWKKRSAEAKVRAQVRLFGIPSPPQMPAATTLKQPAPRQSTANKPSSRQVSNSTNNALQSQYSQSTDGKSTSREASNPMSNALKSQYAQLCVGASVLLFSILGIVAVVGPKRTVMPAAPTKSSKILIIVLFVATIVASILSVLLAGNTIKQIKSGKR